jgi:hypothetical protein
VCRVHGGKGGGPTGERNGAYRAGRYTAEAKAERQAARALIRELRRLINAATRVTDYARPCPSGSRFSLRATRSTWRCS